MEIKKVVNGDALTLELTGRLDTLTSPQVDEEINNSLDGIAHLVFDLTKVEYISSAGLRVILAAQKAMVKKGDMVVTGVSAEIMSLFEMTGFSDILTIK